MSYTRPKISPETEKIIQATKVKVTTTKHRGGASTKIMIPPKEIKLVE